MNKPVLVWNFRSLQQNPCISENGFEYLAADSVCELRLTQLQA